MAKTPAQLGSLARSYCDNAIRVCDGILNNDETPPNVKLQAAGILMDRGLGKPAQAIQIKGDPDSPVVFNLRLGDGIPKTIDGGAVKVLQAPVVATQDGEDPS